MPKVRTGDHEHAMPTNTLELLCFVMGLLLAFGLLTPFLETAVY